MSHDETAPLQQALEDIRCRLTRIERQTSGTGMTMQLEVRDAAGTVLLPATQIAQLDMRATAAGTTPPPPTNQRPHYDGPSSLQWDAQPWNAVQLQGSDPDGDPLTWSIDPGDAAYASVSAGGMIAPLQAMEAHPVTVWISDGRTP